MSRVDISSSPQMTQTLSTFCASSSISIMSGTVSVVNKGLALMLSTAVGSDTNLLLVSSLFSAAKESKSSSSDFLQFLGPSYGNPSVLAA